MVVAPTAAIVVPAGIHVPVTTKPVASAVVLAMAVTEVFEFASVPENEMTPVLVAPSTSVGCAVFN